MKLRFGLFTEILRIALDSIWKNKLRTFLTLLGVIIGVASVMVVGAGLEGAQKFVVDSVSRALGSDAFLVAKFATLGRVSDEEMDRMLRRNKDLRLDDLEFLRKWCQTCSEISGEVGSSQTVYSGSLELQSTSIRGVTSNYIDLDIFDLEQGRFFLDQEVNSSKFICVVGQDVVEKFFPSSDPLGETVKIAGNHFRIAGVVERQGSNFGRSLDNVIYVPITTYQKIFGTRSSVTFRGKSLSRELFPQTLDEVRNGMRVRHKLTPNEDDDFGLISTEEINQTVDQFTAIVASVVVPITLISLVVGGIVIMNIMLVSVTERTFEIGIRKALGARRRDILRQFLIESFVLASLGGLLGVALAWGLAWLVEAAFSFPMKISMGYIILSVGVSGTIGLIFGIYPAFKASKLDPIVAMAEAK